MKYSSVRFVCVTERATTGLQPPPASRILMIRNMHGPSPSGASQSTQRKPRDIAIVSNGSHSLHLNDVWNNASYELVGSGEQAADPRAQITGRGGDANQLSWRNPPLIKENIDSIAFWKIDNPNSHGVLHDLVLALAFVCTVEFCSESGFFSTHQWV